MSGDSGWEIKGDFSDFIFFSSCYLKKYSTKSCWKIYEFILSVCAHYKCRKEERIENLLASVGLAEE